MKSTTLPNRVMESLETGKSSHHGLGEVWFSIKKSRILGNRLIIRSVLLMMLVLTSALAHPQNSGSLLANGIKVLFIGNEKVGSEGGLQNHFRRSVKGAEPALSVETDWISMYDKSTLGEMYTDALVDRINKGNDNLLVIQSGSTSAMLKFAKLAAQANKKLIFFEAWEVSPMLDPEGMKGFQKKTKADAERMMEFQKETGILVVPCGLIWYDLLADPVASSGLRDDYLFVPGSSVQNDMGTLVNVSAIYAMTTGKSPVGLPFWTALPDDLVHGIQARVRDLVGAWKVDDVVIKPIADTWEMPAWPALVKDSDHILYIGNSFIGTEGGLDNHLRRMVALAHPPLNIQSRSIIFWGQGLGRMYTDTVLRAIGSRQDNLIVVTSGPIELLKKFNDTITATGSHMMVHMTWGLNPVINKGGLAAFREQTGKIVESMRQFEQETGVPVAPCGLVFYDLIVDPPEIPGLRTDWVFMVENIHQNHLGTIANVATHYAVMTGLSPVGMPVWEPYPQDIVRAVQERAWKIVREWKEGTTVLKPLSK